MTGQCWTQRLKAAVKSEDIVSGLGLWNMGKCDFHSPISPRLGKDIIKKAYKNGIRAFDTAFSYGEADSILFSAMREMNKEREEYSVWSKVMPVPTLEKKIESSLRRLKSSYFDILMIHWPSDDAFLYNSLKTLETLKEKGITKEIGVSNFPLPLLEKTVNDFQISYHERPLSLIWNKDWEREKKLPIKTIAYSPGGFGLLGGKYSLENPPLDERREIKAFASPFFPLLMKRIKEIADFHSSTPYAVAYSYVMEERPWAIVRGAGKTEDVVFSIPSLQENEREELTRLSQKITLSLSSDNIFSHNWQLR